MADEEVLAALREQVRAEIATATELKRQNDLAEETLRTLQRNLTTDQQRTLFWSNISENVATFVQYMPEMILQLNAYGEKLIELEERIEQYHREDAKRYTRMEYALMILLAGKAVNGNRVKAAELIREFEISSLEDQLQQYHINLRDLQLQKAKYGLAAPTWLLSDIRDTENAIQRITEELERRGKVSDA